MRSSIPASGTAEMATAVTEPRREPTHSALREILSTLGQDKFAAASAAFLLLVLLCALFGPALLGDQARAMNLLQRNAAPFDLEHGLGSTSSAPTRSAAACSPASSSPARTPC